MPKHGITARERECLAILQMARDVPPSHDELKAALGLHSKSGVHRLITSLERKGRITRVPGLHRSIQVTAPLHGPEIPMGAELRNFIARLRLAADALEASMKAFEMGDDNDAA